VVSQPYYHWLKPGMTRIEVKPLTGSILIEFDPKIHFCLAYNKIERENQGFGIGIFVLPAIFF
jgi:hypothetical protein